MSLKVTCKITISNEEYEGGTTAGVALEETGWAGAAPASFASSGSESIAMLVSGAIRQAEDKVAAKLEIIKGEKLEPKP